MQPEKHRGLMYRNGLMQPVKDPLAEEEALQISVNGEPFTVTMRSPGFEEELSRGLLFTEDLYRESSPEPEYEITDRNEYGVTTALNVYVPEHLLLRSFDGERRIASTSSCGLCGKTSFEAHAQPVSSDTLQFDPETILRFFDLMRRQQPEFTRCGGTHAAALFDKQGNALTVREDIGRHNAVDKAIGSLLQRGMLQEACCMAVSGRISYEIVSKSLAAGIALLASVSAPSTLAVKTAEKNGMTLIAFCREDKFTVYTHPDRILTSQPLEKH